MTLAQKRWLVVERGAAVRRYHTKTTIFPQNVGEHSFRMALLLRIMFGPGASGTLILAALTHDLAEAEYGDVPAPTKRRIPHIKEALDNVEHEYLDSHGLCFERLLGADELRRLKLADSLEGYLYSDTEVSMGNVAFVPTRLRYAQYIASLGLTPTEWQAVNGILGPDHDGPLKTVQHQEVQVSDTSNS